MTQEELNKGINECLKLIAFDPALSLFMPGFLRLKYEIDDMQPTAYTDGRRVAISTKYWELCTPAERLGLLIHEMLHCMWRHFLRFQYADLRIANIAQIS